MNFSNYWGEMRKSNNKSNMLAYNRQSKAGWEQFELLYKWNVVIILFVSFVKMQLNESSPIVILQIYELTLITDYLVLKLVEGLKYALV